jgi:hypothetical protein
VIVFVGLLVVALIVWNLYSGLTVQKLSVFGILDVSFGGPAGVVPESTPTARAPTTTFSFPVPPSVPGVTGSSGSGAATGPPLTDCVLTITNPFVSMREAPDLKSVEVGDVPKGQYQTSDTRLGTFAGQAQRWFQITASGRTGWVLYDTIQIDSKSAGCP